MAAGLPCSASTRSASHEPQVTPATKFLIEVLLVATLVGALVGVACMLVYGASNGSNAITQKAADEERKRQLAATGRRDSWLGRATSFKLMITEGGGGGGGAAQGGQQLRLVDKSAPSSGEGVGDDRAGATGDPSAAIDDDVNATIAVPPSAASRALSGALAAARDGLAVLSGRIGSVKSAKGRPSGEDGSGRDGRGGLEMSGSVGAARRGHGAASPFAAADSASASSDTDDDGSRGGKSHTVGSSHDGGERAYQRHLLSRGTSGVGVGSNQRLGAVSSGSVNSSGRRSVAVGAARPSAASNSSAAAPRMCSGSIALRPSMSGAPGKRPSHAPRLSHAQGAPAPRPSATPRFVSHASASPGEIHVGADGASVGTSPPTKRMSVRPGKLVHRAERSDRSESRAEPPPRRGHSVSSRVSREAGSSCGSLLMSEHI